jgi:hypothetical protein
MAPLAEGDSVTASSFTHEATRFRIDVDQSYEAFCERYQSAVPNLDQARIAGFVRAALRGKRSWPTPTLPQHTASSYFGNWM